MKPISRRPSDLRRVKPSHSAQRGGRGSLLPLSVILSMLLLSCGSHQLPTATSTGCHRTGRTITLTATVAKPGFYVLRSTVDYGGQVFGGEATFVATSGSMHTTLPIQVPADATPTTTFSCKVRAVAYDAPTAPRSGTPTTTPPATGPATSA